jgi:hypothetical protein
MKITNETIKAITKNSKQQSKQPVNETARQPTNNYQYSQQDSRTTASKNNHSNQQTTLKNNQQRVITTISKQ